MVASNVGVFLMIDISTSLNLIKELRGLYKVVILSYQTRAIVVIVGCSCSIMRFINNTSPFLNLYCQTEENFRILLNICVA